MLEAVVKELKVGPGQTTRDGLFSLEVVACMVACGLSPVVNINGEFHAKVTPRKLARIIADCRQQETAKAPGSGRWPPRRRLRACGPR